jgi:uncharacterized protein (TIGR02147 family)
MGQSPREIGGIVDPLQILREEYAYRRKKNPRYSLRAFSRYLGIPSGPLSEILGEKRPLTKRMGQKFSQKLGLSPTELRTFLDEIAKKSKHWSSEMERVNEVQYHQLDEDKFELVSSWHHYAIRSLITTRDFKNSPTWIARRLGITKSEVKEALERMCRLGLVEKRQGELVASGGLTTTQDVPSAALRAFHESALELGAVALHKVPVDKRDITSITIAIDPSKLSRAKKIIRGFRRKLTEVLEEGNPTEVYQLNVQLIPLTVRGRGV